MRAFLLALALATGCIFSSVNSAERLRDSINGYNEEVRWNRLDLARERVLPAAQQTFTQQHADWHRRFQIADAEILNVSQVDGGKASSLVVVRWYDLRSMTLSETTLRQEWQRGTGGFYLVREEVTEGAPELLEIPERFRTPADDSGEG